MLDGSRPPRILSLDIATKTGIADGEAGVAPVFYSEQFAGKDDDHEDAFERSLNWIIKRLMVGSFDAVYVEAPINPAAFIGKYNPETGRMGMSTNPDTTIRLIGLWAVLSAAVKVKKIKYRRVNVQTARKSFIGHGNLKGDEAKRRAFEMCKMIGWDPKNRDESDAGCVHYHALTLECPRLAPIITPMMQLQVATRIGGVDMGDSMDLIVKRTAPNIRYGGRRARR